jgi:hypothetical protein
LAIGEIDESRIDIGTFSSLIKGFLTEEEPIARGRKNKRKVY